MFANKLTYEILNKFLPINVDKVAVALSGGADSMVLAYLAHQWCNVNNCKLHLILIDHGLRSESNNEATSVKTYLRERNIDCQIIKWEGAKPKSNISKIARDARYNLLINYCKEHKIKYCLTGHHLNDQAETVLMRILRGSGIDGISGIKAETLIKGVNIIRPLLEITRCEIEAFIKQIDWWHVDDPSNTNTKYTRVVARKTLILLENNFPSINIVKRLNLLSKNAARARKFIRKTTLSWSKSNVVCGDFGYYQINLEAFNELDEEIALRILKKIINAINSNIYPPRLTQLQNLLLSLKLPAFKGQTISGCEVKIYKKNIFFFREFIAIPKKLILEKNKETIWDNRFRISLSFEGYVKPLGLNGWVNLRQNNLLHDKKFELPIKILFTLPALFNENGNLVYVPCLPIKPTNIGVKVYNIVENL